MGCIPRPGVEGSLEADPYLLQAGFRDGLDRLGVLMVSFCLAAKDFTHPEFW